MSTNLKVRHTQYDKLIKEHGSLHELQRVNLNFNNIKFIVFLTVHKFTVYFQVAKHAVNKTNKPD